MIVKGCEGKAADYFQSCCIPGVGVLSVLSRVFLKGVYEYFMLQCYVLETTHSSLCSASFDLCVQTLEEGLSCHLCSKGFPYCIIAEGRLRSCPSALGYTCAVPYIVVALVPQVSLGMVQVILYGDVVGGVFCSFVYFCLFALFI